jgi:hypothetical protein
MIVKARYERTAMADIINPVNGYRGMLALAGQTPKDHRKENLNILKAKQEENKKMVEDQAKPKPDPFKMRKFQNVPSKLSLLTTEPGTASGSPDKERPKTAASCRARSAAMVAFGRTSHQEEVKHEEEHELENINHLNLEHSSIEQIPIIEKHKAFGKVP